MIRKLKSLLTKMYIKLQEQTREERLKYSFPKKYPNIEDHAEILKAVIGANTSDNEQKIIGSEKTEMIHQNKKECSCALALLQERTYLLRTY